MGRFNKKKIQDAAQGVELNVMPFIDIFSLLCTFLLFSAVFISIGVHVVQVPFITNASSSTKETKREISVKIDLEKTKVTVTTEWSSPPVNQQEKSFDRNPDGLSAMNSYLMSIKDQNQKVELVTLFTADDLILDDIVVALDHIKFKKTTNPSSNNSIDLFPKVVLGSVIL